MQGNPKNAGRSKKALCISCARNKHRQCDLHVNDGAFDAEDFINVRCDCFCEGRIGTEFDSLVAMAEHYAEQVQEFQEETRQVRMLAARAAGVADEVMEIIRALDARARDDEGNLLILDHREHVDRVLDEFFLQMKTVANKSEAVLALLAEDSGFTVKNLVNRLVEVQSSDPYDACDDDFDGPIGDGPQGVQKRGPGVLQEGPYAGRVTEPGGRQRDATSDEIAMVEQYRKAQAVLAERAKQQINEDTGWPVD